MEFCKAFNEKKSVHGKTSPVITVYKDKKFDFIIKSPPASHFIRKRQNLRVVQASQVELWQVLSQ